MCTVGLCVLCYLLWGFIGCLCGFSKCEFEFKVMLCRWVDCSVPYQQCERHTLCECMCVSSVMLLRAMCASLLKTFMARRAERGQIGPERTTLHTLTHPHKQSHWPRHVSLSALQHHICINASSMFRFFTFSFLPLSPTQMQNFGGWLDGA